METATLTSAPHSSHNLLNSSRRSIGRRRKRVLADGHNVPVSGSFIQAGFSEVQLHRRIGLGYLCIQSRRRGSTGNNCHGRVNPLMLLERLRTSTSGFLASPVSAACSGANFSVKGGYEGRESKITFHTRISTRPYKWHRWLKTPPRIMSAACSGRSGDFISDEFGPYPWDPSWNASDNEALEWIQEDIITLFTTDGLIQIGGSLVPHQSPAAERRQSRGKTPVRYRRFREEDYMDPKQGLCLGAIFDIVATNGLDMGRRLCVFGFCRSIEMLSDVVEDTVLEQGGEVVVAAKGNRGGLNEKLSMRVAVPLLWGVPPAVDTLNYAIRCGGGIVEKVSCQWEFL